MTIITTPPIVTIRPAVAAPPAVPVALPPGTGLLGKTGVVGVTGVITGPVGIGTRPRTGSSVAGADIFDYTDALKRSDNAMRRYWLLAS